MSKPAFINGYVDGDGGSSSAARADHKHSGIYEPANALLLKAAPAEIKAADWDNKAAAVAYPEGMQSYVGYMVAAGSAADAATAALVLTTAGESGLTFGVTTTPETDIDLFILYC